VHEVSLVAELVEAAETRSGGAQISLVRVRHATTIPDDVLRQAFEMLTVTGPLAGSGLELESFEVRFACACGFDGVLGHDDVIGPSQVVCPACGELGSVPPTAELELLEVRPAG
jgi:Zn finger protein HypA/HybF involved in hydrogenase expression